MTRIECRTGAAGAFGWLMAAMISMLVFPASAQDREWEFGGDLRAGFYASERDFRDGSGEERSESARGRFRLFAQRDLSDNWSFRGRVATWLTSDGNDVSLEFDRYRATGTGTRPGEVHLDEFFLQWADDAGRNQLRIGRFQTGFKLPVVPDKSLDRNDSSNVGIGWTDGLHWTRQLGGGWESHVIAQAHHRRGTGNTVRNPISFSDDSSRLGAFLGLRSTERWGPVSMRMLTLNWMPDALAPMGVSDPRREDYLTMTAKAAAEWPVGAAGTRFVLAGEYGHAFETPRERTMLLDSPNGDVGGDGFQVSANFFDIRPGHNLGVVYGHVESGWLISNDFRNNDDLYEVRYQHHFNDQLRVDVRFRIREEIERRAFATDRQQDRDLYVRFTYKL
ncbi:hypothetical protein [Wenzhouxiangella sp. EGI_FJ10409]|uniref:hypothetical protein n=1 Tax=Wenzhouxiangella sp. EGI_FJ10409 TaxID=3243767 RepID=UPI0035DA26E4